MTGPFKLIPHPDHLPRAIQRIEMTAERVADERLYLWCMVYGEISRLKLPPRAHGRRADDLWQSTCFELFMKLPHGYCEFNLSPSTSWAAYQFSDYRSEMRELPLILAPEIDQDAGGDWYEFEAWIAIPNEVQKTELSLGLTAVIEEQGGHKSYWALAHPDGPPDFHNRDCFIAHLPPVTAP